MRRSWGGVGGKDGSGYLDLLLVPAWLALVWGPDTSGPDLEILATIVLSFVAWLYVRRR